MEYIIKLIQWNIKNYPRFKTTTDVAFTISSGREFHSLIVRGKKENLKYLSLP